MSHLTSTAAEVREPVEKCVFCGISSEEGFSHRVVFEVSGIAKHAMERRFPDPFAQDNDYIVFKDRNPVAEHHLLVIPRIHVGAVQNLRKSRAGE
jgi:diadenosine tetraphosphate (Ap4A) HIT family hydrolase